MGILKDSKGNYRLTGKTTETDVLAAAEGILRSRLERQGSIGNPRDASDFMRTRLGALLHEEFHILWLDNRHRILDCQKLFTGTIDGASIYPREVVRAALNINACAAILAHNHPSGVAEPSAADRAITKELADALHLVGVRVLDHIVISAAEGVSMAVPLQIDGNCHSVRPVTAKVTAKIDGNCGTSMHLAGSAGNTKTAD